MKKFIILLAPLILILSQNSSAKVKTIDKRYKLVTQSPNSTNQLIELPQALEVKKINDRLIIYRYVNENKGTHVKSHSFTRKMKKTPVGAIDKIEDKGFKLRFTESFQQLKDKAIAIINYELISGSYKGLKTGDKYTNTFVYSLNNINKVHYQFTHSLNGKKPIVVNATYK